MLTAAGYQLPTQVHIHGFLTVDGEKMSKSKGTFVRARTYLETVGDPAYLRYYFASKLSRKVEDIDLNLGEFVDKVNSDLVGKVVNLASRCANFIAASGLAPGITTQWPAEGVQLLDSFRRGERRSPRSTTAAITPRRCAASWRLPTRPTSYVETAAPWKLAKDARAGQRSSADRLHHRTQPLLALTVLLAPGAAAPRRAGRRAVRRSHHPVG
jgi:methionyl-tRNA synthetase